MSNPNQKRVPVTQVEATGETLATNKPLPGKRMRTKMTPRDILTVHNKDPNLEYRYIADREGRVLEKMDQGWVVVHNVNGEITYGDARVNEGTSIDSRITLRSGGEILVLMAIRKDWKKQDHDEHNAYVDKLEQQLKRKGKKGFDPDLEGEVSISRG